MDPSPADAASGGRSAAALRAIITWTLSAVNSRGDFPKIDPNIVLDSSTLRRVGKAVAVYSTKPLVNGAVVLLEIFARIILLLIFLALSFSPSRRTVVVNRMRITLEGHVNSVRRLGLPEITDKDAFAKSHLPPDARLLIVGAGGVGKSSISRALQRYARKAGLEQLPIAEAHGPQLPDLDALGDGLELVLVVWEAALGTPLPAYVGRFATQIRAAAEAKPRESGRERRSRRKGGLEAARESDESPSEAPSPRGLRRRAKDSKERLAEAVTGTSTGDAVVDDDAATPLSPAKASTAATSGASSGVYRAPRVLVVCNKCDVMPCPMPQIKGLPPAQAFIAVSAEKGTNLAHLWGMVHPVLCPEAQKRPSRSVSPAHQLSRLGAPVAARAAVPTDVATAP